MKLKFLFFATIFFLCQTLSAQIVFQKNYGDTLAQNGYSVKQCFDGGYIFTGYAQGVPYYNVFLVRTNEFGDTLWTRKYGSDNMVGFDVIQTADSNFVLCGYIHSSGPAVHLKKVDANGNTMWTSIFGSGWGQAIQQTFDGGFIVAGYQLIKTNAVGTPVWTKPATGDQAMYVIQTADSGYVMTGFSSNYIYLAKTNSSGTTIWTKTFSGTTHNCSNNNFAHTADGGYIITGQNVSGGTLLIKTDSLGNEIWRKNLPGDCGTSVVQNASGGYVIGGYSSPTTQMILIETDASGDPFNSHLYGSYSSWVGSKSIRQTSDGGYVMVGSTSPDSSSNIDAFLVKIDSLGRQNLDAGVSQILSSPISGCGSSFSPQVVIKNYGYSTLTSCSVYYSVDGNAPILYNWAGSLSTNQTDTISFGTLSISNSVHHTFISYTSAPNGGVDSNSWDDSKIFDFILPPSSSMLDGVSENFESGTFPSTDWSIQNPDNGLTWKKDTLASGFGYNSNSAEIEFYNILAKEADYFYLPALNFSGITHAKLKFDVAYCQYSSENDSLLVQASIDCGSTWNNYYVKHGSTLSTTVPHTIYFIPNQYEWRRDTVGLAALIGNSEVLIRFKGISQYGNNLYLDNINISGTLGIDEQVEQNQITVFPNPSTGKLTVVSETTKIKNIKIYNTLGELVLSTSSLSFELESDPGVYYMQVIDDQNNILNKKIILQ